jgi:hypothetical protein
VSDADIAITIFEMKAALVREVPLGCDDGTEPEWNCYVYSSDYDSVADALGAYADAVEKLHELYKRKYGGEAPGVADDIAEARSLLAQIPKHKSGDLVTSEDRNRMVMALNALVRATLKLEGALP